MAEETQKLPRWKSHKEVEAFKIAKVLWNHPIAESVTAAVLEGGRGLWVRVEEAYIKKHNPQIGGYYVRYADGYESFSPAEAFEEGYGKLGSDIGPLPRIIDKERLKTILIRCIGDTRECPHCRKAFVPEDMAQKDAWKFYNDTFGMPAANKFERRAFEKIDEETLHEISRPLLPGKVQAVKPPLGVMPQRIWKEKRIMDLSRAIHEYAGLSNLAGDPGLLVKWASELLHLTADVDHLVREVKP